MAGLQQTFALDTPRADFHTEDFDTLIFQKGRLVILEKALVCPCKNPKSGAQSTCKNCGGTGWIFINPIETRIVTQAMDVVNKFQPWSEEARGTMRVSCRNAEELCWMDRITALDGEAIFTQTISMKKKGGQLFAFTAYNVKRYLYVGMFMGTGEKLKRLVAGIDYTFEDNIFKLDASYVVTGEQDISISLRYVHAPTYHMIEMTRETMQSFEWKGFEKLIHLPQAGLAKRAHYILTAQNLNGDRLLDNSYDESCVISVPDCGCPK